MAGAAPPFNPDLPALLAPLVGRLVVALIIAVVAWRIAASARRWFETTTARSSADIHLRVIVGRFLYLAVLFYGLLWAVEVMGISPTALVAGFGVLGLAASLALQDILKSFCAGVYLLFERPFRIGDTVKVKDFQGRVVDIGIRITVLHTEDGREVLIPNSVVLADVVVNSERRRIPFTPPGTSAPPDEP
jgi:small conductance mechanosensitive channel